MLVIPAIDIKDGKTVRLKQGDFSEKTVYSQTPVESALSFQNAGAKRLHLVDLDGAESGEAPNRIIVEKNFKQRKNSHSTWRRNSKPGGH